jgi:NADH dehydrogenase
MQPYQVVILGGGFGGLTAARRLKRAPANVTLVDRHNYHLFQPLLYQVATGGLSPANIAAPLRSVLGRQKNMRVLMAEAVDVDLPNRALILRDGHRLHYDALIVATGSQFNYFGHDRWSQNAPGLKTIEDAVDIRRRVLGAFEKAELESDPERQREMITFVVVGAGPTGVELAGALAEVAHHTLRHDFRNVDPRTATILLLEAQDHVLTQFPLDLREKALASLARLGVTVRLKTTVTEIEPHAVLISRGDSTEKISCGAVMWTAGVKASPFAAALAKAAGAETDRGGHIIVQPDLTLAGHPEVFVIGDLARSVDASGRPLPGLAPVAMQQGRYVAKTILRRLKAAGQESLAPFRFVDRGNLATIGRAAAVADLGRVHLSGYLAWLAWLFIHLVFLMQFHNRLLVFLQWCYSYFTRGRSARLITEDPPRAEG